MGVIIVLADDEPELRAIYSACLRAAGHEVWEACDGEEAVELVIARKPSLLILDVWMPRVNGFEVLERLRQASHCSNLRVVMLSNLGDSDTRLEGFAVGVADYWIKGLSLADLRGRVERLMADIELSTDPG
jgi:two-component system sensor histidine kinase ChiS